MIKVNWFRGSHINTDFAGVDFYRLANHVHVEVGTDFGTLRYTMRMGFPTNMRSGSHAIDWLIPKFTGNNLYNLAILCHDFAYTKNRNGEHYIRSRELADELLRQMVILSGELGSFRASIMHRALRIGGGSAWDSDNTGAYKDAGLFMSFRWDAK